MIKKLGIPFAALVPVLGLALHAPFRRWRESANPVNQWVTSAGAPSFAALTSSGTIVEANAKARALFPEQSLLEMDLAALFPAHRREILTALVSAERTGAAAIYLDGPRGPLLMIVLRAPEEPRLVIATLVTPGQERMQTAPRPALMAACPPLPLSPSWLSLSPEARLKKLLVAVSKRWPVERALLFRRRRFDITLLVTSDDRFDEEAFPISAMELSRLLQDGMTVQIDMEGRLLLLHPIYLVAETQAWGAIAFLCDAHTHFRDELVQGIAHVATIASLFLDHSHGHQRQRAHARHAQQQRAMRDHLVATHRRGVLLVDPAGRLETLNEAASKLLHWPRDDVIGRPLTALLDDLGPLGVKIALALASRDGSESYHGSGRLQRPGRRGSEIHFTVEHVAGASDYLFIFVEDHERMVAAGETLHHLDRLAVLGKMSAMIAHDLRNPLSSLLYGIDTLAETLGEDHPESGTIQLLLEEGERIHRIIDDILSISRQPSLTINLCSLQTLMEQILESHHRQLTEKRIKVRKHFEPSLPMIEGDSVRLGQMFGNLISNAIDALDPGGHIDVVLRPLALEQIVARGLNLDQEERLQGGVEILIRDNGPGIGESHREQIFEPLYTTKSTGTGLGLAIVRTIVEQHRGFIYLDSELGKGTTFQLFLPQLGSAYRRQDDQLSVK